MCQQENLCQSSFSYLILSYGAEQKTILRRGVVCGFLGRGNQTLFQIETCHFPHPFSDENGSKSIPYRAAHTCIAYIGITPPGKQKGIGDWKNCNWSFRCAVRGKMELGAGNLQFKGAMSPFVFFEKIGLTFQNRHYQSVSIFAILSHPSSFSL